jgi:hypothetical protein
MQDGGRVGSKRLRIVDRCEFSAGGQITLSTPVVALTAKLNGEPAKG